MKKMLVVDDSKMDRILAGKCVSKGGLEAIYANDGREALEVIQREKPAFVLTDLQMPEMDGLELVRQIKEKHPTIPVILMTAYGSEEIAAKALQAGATSYVPKEKLRQNLPVALGIVGEAADAIAGLRVVQELLVYSESHFVIGYEQSAPGALIGYLSESLAHMHVLHQAELLQVSTALTEAIRNAVDHGNLELDSALRETSDEDYRELGNRRSVVEPYCNRRVHLTHRITPTQMTFVVRDEGPGFDPSSLPDPTDPENLLRPFGRGLMLINAFMDEVNYNEAGNEITMVKYLAA